MARDQHHAKNQTCGTTVCDVGLCSGQQPHHVSSTHVSRARLPEGAEICKSLLFQTCEAAAYHFEHYNGEQLHHVSPESAALTRG